jgi:hypothetical protein
MPLLLLICRQPAGRSGTSYIYQRLLPTTASQHPTIEDQADSNHRREVANKGEDEPWTRRVGGTFRDSSGVHGFSVFPVC